MCCAEFLVKYILFFTNLIFSLAGLALIGVGTAVLIQLGDVFAVVPVQAVPITTVVVGALVFLIAFLGCCGAIQESCCMLVLYSICMAVLAIAKIYLSTLIFGNLNDLNSTVEDWLNTAFNANNREPFHLVEIALRCCGTTGAASYGGVALPPSCCDLTAADGGTCSIGNAYGGCVDGVADYIDTFGSAIGGVIIVVIIVEGVAVLFGSFLAHAVNGKRKA